jgi:hypothetical protein
MTDAEKEVINKMRERGYAIAIFYPEETSGYDIGYLESAMVEGGVNYLDNAKKG